MSGQNDLYRVPQEERSIFCQVIVSVDLSRKIYMYMCPIPNDFRDRVILLYSSKIVHKKVILCTDSNTGMYCSSDKVGTTFHKLQTTPSYVQLFIASLSLLSV
jgi:hypothetical protein